MPPEIATPTLAATTNPELVMLTATIKALEVDLRNTYIKRDIEARKYDEQAWELQRQLSYYQQRKEAIEQAPATLTGQDQPEQ